MHSCLGGTPIRSRKEDFCSKSAKLLQGRFHSSQANSTHTERLVSVKDAAPRSTNSGTSGIDDLLSKNPVPKSELWVRLCMMNVLVSIVPRHPVENKWTFI